VKQVSSYFIFIELHRDY